MTDACHPHRGLHWVPKLWPQSSPVLVTAILVCWRELPIFACQNKILKIKGKSENIQRWLKVNNDVIWKLEYRGHFIINRFI